MSLDYAEFQKFYSNFNSFSNSYTIWLIGFVRNIASSLLANVQERTPVDTGRLRDYWEIGEIQRKGDLFEIQIFNSTYYADFVEFGHAKPYKAGATEGSIDWVDGYFMLTVSLQQLEQNLPVRFEKEFSSWLKQFGI